jgi:hypothetical protein
MGPLFNRLDTGAAAKVALLANTTSLVNSAATPAFVLARVSPVDVPASLLVSENRSFANAGKSLSDSP